MVGRRKPKRDASGRLVKSGRGSPKQQARAINRDLLFVASFAAVAITLDIHANLVAAPSDDGTPIDTGFASSNWIPKVGPGPTAAVGAPEAVTRGPQEQGVAEVLGYEVQSGGILTVTNNANYIEALNVRHPRAGFVERGVKKALTRDFRDVEKFIESR